MLCIIIYHVKTIAFKEFSIVFAADLLSEISEVLFQVVNTFGLTKEDVIKLVRNAIQSSFADDHEKEVMYNKLKAYTQ